MTKTIHGKIHGKTIELDEDLGVAEGQEVEVHVTIVQPARKWGDGILRTAGASQTIRTGMPSWKRYTSPARSNVGPKRRISDSPAGYEHLLGSHAASRWFGPSVLSIRWRDRRLNCRVGGTVLGVYKHPNSDSRR